MRKFKGDDMVGGWFVGNFEPTVYKTKEFEVCYKQHCKGEKWPSHYHNGIEINYLIHGRMYVNDAFVCAGDVFVLDSGEVVRPEFLDDCELIVVKVPSDPNDKYIVED